jgi:hypothetical protein
MFTNLCRRDFLDVFLLLMGAYSARVFGIGSSHARPTNRNEASIGAWVGEALKYRADCPLLPRIATGKIELKRVRGSSTFLATLETRIEGVVGVLTLQRKDLFASLMSWSEPHQRLLPVWYAEQVSRMGSWRRKVLLFHHEKGRYIEHKFYPDRFRQKRIKTLGKILIDPLCAFYNWRIGAYGPLGPGRSQNIDNLARKDPFVLRVQTASREQTLLRRKKVPDPEHKAHLLRARLDKRFMDVVHGDVEAWVDEEWMPIYGKASEVKWVREVTVYLLQKDQSPNPELNTYPLPPLKHQPWTIS